MSNETLNQPQETQAENNSPDLLSNVETQATPDTAEAVTEDQSQETDRPEWLPEKFKTPEDLAKSYGELEKKMTNHVPKAYDFTVTKDVGLAEMPQDLANEITEVFKKANFSQDQVKTAMALYSDQIQKVQQQIANAPRVDLDKEEGSLKQQWGNDYSKRIDAVKKFATTIPERVLNQPLVDTAEGIMFLETLMEGNRMPNPIQNTTVNTRQDPHAIREEIQKMRGDDKFKLPPGDPVGDNHRQRLYTLYEQLDRLEPKN